MQKIIIEPVQKMDYNVMEEIKMLRTTLKYLKLDKNVITITSVVGKEGKSLISFWISHSLAELGKKVILVDANIRSANKHDIFTTDKDIKSTEKKDTTKEYYKNMKGLTEYLLGKVKQDEIICSTNVPDLDIVLSGNIPSNPTELLSGISFRNLISYLKEKYDYIIIDTPALGEVTDAAIIAEHCDNAILVLEPGVTPYKLAQKVKVQLEESGTKILGVVLNKA